MELVQSPHITNLFRDLFYNVIPLSSCRCWRHFLSTCFTRH